MVSAHTIKHDTYSNYDVWFQHTQSNMSYVLTTMYGFSTVKLVIYTYYDVWF